jgi:hypothetical protein
MEEKAINEDKCIHYGDCVFYTYACEEDEPEYVCKYRVLRKNIKGRKRGKHE